MEGYQGLILSPENKDTNMNSNQVFPQVAYIILPINKEMLGSDNEELFKLMGNVYASLTQLKKSDSENENFRGGIKQEEMKLKENEEKFCKIENERSVKNNELNSRGFLNYEDKKMEINSHSDSDFININEVKLANNDENLDSSLNLDANDKICLESSPKENEEITTTIDDNKILRKSCLDCGNSKVIKKRKYCFKCANLRKKKLAFKCGCNKPHYGKGLCSSCYQRMKYRKVNNPDKICNICKSQKLNKNQKKFCSNCRADINKKKVEKCNCDKPHHAKGLCRSCYNKMYRRKNIQIKTNSLSEIN
jgi:hypothetical protein